MSDLMYPVETINLPSGGKYYPEGHPLRENGGQLELKYMTAKEEDILTSTNLIKNGTVIDRLLDSLVVHEGVRPADLTTGDINAVLIAARVLAYGKEYDVSFDCPSCESEINHKVDLSELETPEDLIDVDENGHLTFVTETGLEISIKALTRGDEMTIEKNNRIMKSKYKKTSSEVTSRLKNIIVSINGQTEKNALSSMIDNLVVRDTKRIREEFDKINPSVDMTTEFICEDCDYTMKGVIPIGIDFFWPDIQL